MTSSLKFGSGFGSKRFKIIINEYPNILNITVTEGMITKLPGFRQKLNTIYKWFR